MNPYGLDLDAETMQICSKGVHMYSNLHGMNLISEKEIEPVIFVEKRNEKKNLMSSEDFQDLTISFILSFPCPLQLSKVP